MADQICENVKRETVEQLRKKYWCIKCGTNPRRQNQRWCLGCHASWKRNRLAQKVEQKLQSITSSLEPMTE